jgi:hypothetical protein
MVGRGQDILRAHLTTLAETTEQLETWVRNFAANPQPTPTMTKTPRAEDAGPAPSIIDFDVFNTARWRGHAHG